MSKANKLAINDRVQLIPYKHKGKQGHIRYIGEIEGKASGNWVGIEIDEAKGDCSGDFGGKLFFECKLMHGIFLRPTQVKIIDSFQTVGVSRSFFDEQKTDFDQSPILKVDESMTSGVVKELFGSNGGDGNVDTKNILNGLQDPTQPVMMVETHKNQTENPVSSEDLRQPSSADADAADQTSKGKVSGWKVRLEMLRKQKEEEKNIEFRITPNADDGCNENSIQILSAEMQQSEDKSKLNDMFAPAKGLKAGADGKLQIDQKTAQKKDDLKIGQKKSDEASTPQEEAKRSTSKQKQDLKVVQNAMKQQKVSPYKQKSEQNMLNSSKISAQTARSGISQISKGPGSSRITSYGQKQPVDKKQALIDKQNQLKEQRDQKGAKKEPQSARYGQSRLGIGGVKSGIAGSQASSRNLRPPVKGTVKTGEVSNVASQGTAQSRIGNVQSKLNTGVSNINSGISSIKQNDSSKQTSSGNLEGDLSISSQGEDSNAKRGKSSGDLKSQFGGKVSMDQEDIKGASLRGKSNTTSASAKIDADSTVIKKLELQQMKDEIQKLNEQLYSLEIKIKSQENKTQVSSKDNADNMDQLTKNLNEQNMLKQEELIKKHNEERNKFIEESSKSGDDKYVELKEQYNILKKERDDMEEKYKLQIDQMIQQHLEEKQKYKEQSQKTINDLEVGLNRKLEEKTKSSDENKIQCNKLAQEVQLHQKENTELKQKNSELAQKNEAQALDLEANQIELELALDEKDTLLKEMTESNIDSDDVVNSLSTEELKTQNRRMRAALTSLTTKFEDDRQKLLSRIADEEGKKKIIAEYEDKLADMDVLLEELDRKETELAEIQMENEACMEYEEMVEDMAREILRMEDEKMKLNKRFKNLEEVLETQEGYTENLEQFNQELAEEVGEWEAKMNQFELQKVEDEELLIDIEDENQKYSAKIQQLSKTIKDLTIQVQDQSESDDQKSNIQMLIEKQNSLTQQIKENDKKEIDNKLRKIDYHWQKMIKQKVIEGIIPKRLYENIHLDSVEKINLLNQSSNRALLMFRYICEKQMPNVQNMYGGEGEEDMQNKTKFIKMMIGLCDKCVLFINAVQKIIICLSNMSIEQYIKATTTFAQWKHISNFQTEMESIIEKLKNENISLKFDLSTLQDHIKHIMELDNKIEKFYIEKTPEEIREEKVSCIDNDKSKYHLTAAQLERQKFVQSEYKLDLRHQALKMCYAIVAVRVILNDLDKESKGSQNSSLGKKSQLIYGRLIDIVFKVDHIDAEDNGNQYLNLQELLIDKRLSEKFEVIKFVWQDGVNSESTQEKDWNSVMDAIQKDINQVFNDYKFKRLIKHVESIYENEGKQANIDQIFFIDKFKNDVFPWIQISKKIKDDIQKSQQLKDKIENLTNKYQEQMKKQIQDEREMGLIMTTNKSLEQRLSSTTTEIELLKSIKHEHEQTCQKQGALKKQLEAQIAQNGELKKQNEVKDQMYQNAKEKIANQPEESNTGPFQQSAEGVTIFKRNRKEESSRKSRAFQFFQQMTSTSLHHGHNYMSPRGGSRSTLSRPDSSTIINNNSVGTSQLLVEQEEQYRDIIHHLQMDRMRLRGKDLSDKLVKMQKSPGAFNDFVKLNQELKETRIRISKEEESKLIKTVENIDTLKSHAKLLMANIKVTDLKKQKEQKDQKEQALSQQAESPNKPISLLKKHKTSGLAREEIEKSDCNKTNMNINYMIMQARDQMNNAIKTLTDSNQSYSQFQINKQMDSVSTDEDSESIDNENQIDNKDGPKEIKKRNKSIKNTVEIGSITFGSGANSEKSKARNVVFNVKSLRNLQSNMGVLSI